MCKWLAAWDLVAAGAPGIQQEPGGCEAQTMLRGGNIYRTIVALGGCEW